MPFYVRSGIVEGWFGFTVALSLPKQQSFALSADQTVLGQAFVLPGLLCERESRFGPCRSLPLCQSVCPPVSHCLTRSFFHPPVYLSVTSASLSLLFVFISPLSFISSSLTFAFLIPVLCYPSLSLSKHAHTHLITTASVQHICLVSDVCECVKLGEMSCVIWPPPLSLSLPLSDL